MACGFPEVPSRDSAVSGRKERKFGGEDLCVPLKMGLGRERGLQYVFSCGLSFTTLAEAAILLEFSIPNKSLSQKILG